MPNPFELLLTTMPFAGAMESVTVAGLKSVAQLSAAEVRRRVLLLEDGASIHVELPALDVGLPLGSQPLWAFTYSTSRPAEVSDLYCRVRDADNVGHHVADRVAWGLEAGYEPFKSEVRVKLAAGADLRLPLTRDFLLWAFRVRGGYIPEDHSKLWRLASELDTSIVAVLAYDIDPATGQITKTDFDKVRDPALREDLQEMSRAVKELLGGGWPSDVPEHLRGVEGSDAGGNLQPPPPDVDLDPESVLPAPTSNEDEPEGPVETPAGAGPEPPWGQRVLRGDLFPVQEGAAAAGAPAAPMGVSGEVGESVDVETEPARLLVVFSFTTCRERADFEPGGIVGFARCYPHLMLATTVPVESVEGSAHIDRPRVLSKWPEGERDLSASCCKPPYDGWTQEIGSLLVTDVNENPNFPEPLPYWPNMFFYHIVDPFLRHGQKKYHVVRTDRGVARDSDTPLVHRRVAGPDFGTGNKGYLLPEEAERYNGKVRKEPRQGAFDNIHMAPRLRLMNVHQVADGSSWNSTRHSIEDRKAWHLDDIAMAPFCAHDCLHLHFRWGRFATKKQSLGWNATGPYAEAGAPQVPPEQDVWVWFRARASLTYHVLATSPRFIDGWHTLMHHGFGYAVSIQAAILHWLAVTGVDHFSNVWFIAPDGDIVEAQASTAAYYWKARYGYEVVDGEARPFERLSWASEADLEEAMDL